MIAESYEKIHRSYLIEIEIKVLLAVLTWTNAKSIILTGEEKFNTVLGV